MIYMLFLFLPILSVSGRLFQKQYNNMSRDAEQSSNIYVLVTSLFAMIFFAAMAKWDVRANLVTLIYAVFLALFAVLANLITLKALEKTDIVTISVFSGAGAIVFPFLYGIIFLNEKFECFKILSFFLLLLIVILPVIKEKNREKTDLQGYLYCLILFFEAGGATILYKLYAMEDSVMSSNVFCFWGNVLILPFMCFLALRTERYAFLHSVRQLHIGAYLSAVLSVLSSNAVTLLEVHILGKVDLSFYTLFKNPFSLIITALLSRLFFQEKITKEMAFNIGLSVAALVLSGI